MQAVHAPMTNGSKPEVFGMARDWKSDFPTLAGRVGNGTFRNTPPSPKTLVDPSFPLLPS
ncbi:MAG: hypothetical protein DYG96_09440 [Chlorobi bacterium CHB2]|nr:hypothetical protein [Chlorobi bacterium CHB2]